MVDEFRTRPTRQNAPPPKREDLLASIETVAAGPAKRRIARAQEADTERRTKAVKAMQPRFALVWATVALLLTVAGIVLLLPDPMLDIVAHPILTLTGEARGYTFDLYQAGFIALAGAMMATGAIVHWLLEARRPRSLPYPARIYIPYLLFGVPAASGAVARLIGFDTPSPLTTLGVGLAAAATAAFVVLLVFSMRSPSAQLTVWRGSEKSRELDRQYRSDVRRAIYDNKHVHTGPYRAQALEGIRQLYAHQLTDAEGALWMLREIAPGPAAAAE